jgi:predicted nucleotide-binding protein
MRMRGYLDDEPEERSWYDTMQVCLGGHVITSMLVSQPEYGRKRCSECGKATISSCPKCSANIRGHHHIPNAFYVGGDDAPIHCENCGEKFPWAEITRDLTQSTTKAEIVKEIFIIHGHDEEMKQGVARILSQLGLVPIILHEQPNSGRTIIEKFEDHAATGFAVALLSPDDKGFRSSEKSSSAKSRARQNVVLELGYFVGKLGRSKVVALVRGDVEIPSDFAGVVYTPYDASGRWKFDLVKELKAAGYEVDANEII